MEGVVTNSDQQAEELKNQGNEEFKKGNYLPAIECYSQALELIKNEGILTNRAASYINLKKFKEALFDCEQALIINPTFAKAHLRAHKCYLSLGELEKARESAKLALELGESTAAQLLQQTDQLLKYEKFGNAASANKETKEALHYFNMLLNQCPDSVKFIGKKIEVLLAANKLPEALEYTTGIQNRWIENAEFLYWRGRLLVYTGNTEKGKQHFREAISKDPDNVNYQKAWRNVQKMENLKKEAGDAFSSHNFPEAIEKFTLCLDLDPLNAQYNSAILFNRACAYNKLSKNSEAICDLTKAVELNEDYTKAYIKRGDISLQQSDFEQAARDYEKAQQIDPTQHGLREKVKHAKLELKKSKRKDYYKLLGVGKEADENEIKKAYKKQALRWHPDKHSNGTEEARLEADKTFKDIGEAYAILSDPQKRQRYDAGADIEEIENGHSGFGGGGMDPNDIFKMFFAGGGGMGGGGGGNPFGGGSRGGNFTYTFQ